MRKPLEEIENCGFRTRINFDLEKAFDLALQDEDFKELVSKINVPKSTAIKYTSILEKSKVEYKNCSKCKNILQCKNQINGYCYLPRVENNKLIFEYKICKYKEKLQKEHQHQENMYFFDIPSEIRDANIKDIYANDNNRIETIKWIYKYIKSYNKDPHQKGLYLNGNFGCGKTYLISAMFNELAKQDVKSAIIFWPDFLNSLKSSFQTDYLDKLDYIKKVPLLLIDDIGAENTTEWSRDEIFCPIVQYRMENRLATFFTSNLTLEELEQHFSISKNKVDPVKSRRIIERIKQLTENLSMISKNLRK